MNKKIFSDFESIKSSIEKIRNKKKIILCHGVFDLFHAGHLYSLKKAKELGDVLIVSLTSDRYVKKGPSRPFFKFDQRADVIAGLSVVDYVLKVTLRLQSMSSNLLNLKFILRDQIIKI